MKNLDSIIPISDEGLYPIRSVSEISGVNSITLRAWERRYGLFEPKRTPKGHRLYSEKDIVRVQQVLDLLSKGVSIGRVAKALKNQQPIAEISEPPQTELKTIKSLTSKEWDKHQETLLNRIHTYDILQLEAFHHEFLSSYTIEIITKNLIRPVLALLNERAIQSGPLSGDYHFYSMFLLHRIGGLFLRTSIRNAGKKLLLIGIDDKHNDVGLLLYSLPLMKHGYQVINMGSDVCLDALPMAVSASNADGVLLYSELNSTKNNTDSFQNLVNNINSPVFFRGTVSENQKKELIKAGLFLLPDKCSTQVTFIDKKLNKVIK